MKWPPGHCRLCVKPSARRAPFQSATHWPSRYQPLAGQEPALSAIFHALLITQVTLSLSLSPSFSEQALSYQTQLIWSVPALMSLLLALGNCPNVIIVNMNEIVFDNYICANCIGLYQRRQYVVQVNHARNERLNQSGDHCASYFSNGQVSYCVLPSSVCSHSST